MVEYWTVKNDCNGVFHDTLSTSQARAKEWLATGQYGDGAYLAPVVMFEATDPLKQDDKAVVMRVMRHGAPLYRWGFL